MSNSVEKWYQALKVRRSCRKFARQFLDRKVLEHMLGFISQLNNWIEGTRIILVTDNPEQVFKGIIGNYGKIENAPAYVAFIGDMSNSYVQENIGYLGECFILEATALGLATCWVGGFFKPKVVQSQIQITSDEKVLAVSPIGYWAKESNLVAQMQSGAAIHKRKSLHNIVQGLPQDQWSTWVKPALEAARLAPSAINRQPWNFEIGANDIKIFATSSFFSFGVSKRLDCGIAMAHLEIGVRNVGGRGRWEYLADPGVARFVFERESSKGKSKQGYHPGLPIF